VHGVNSSFDRRVEGGWDGPQEGPEEALLVTFMPKGAPPWGYYRGF